MREISIKLVQVIVAGAAVAGVAPPTLLEAAGLAADQLADPDARISLGQATRLWHEAARLTGDESFGLHLSERLPIDGFGALGFALRSSPTLGEAYERAARYLRLVARGPTLAITLEGPLARIVHEPPATGHAPSRHAVEFLLANLVMAARRGVDPAFVPRAARFRHAAPTRVDEHRRLFGGALGFGEARDELLLDRRSLASPQAQAEPALCEVLDLHLASLLAALPDDRSFLDRARAALAAEIGHGEPSLAALAARLRLSPRSLQRRLQQEGSSLSSLLDGLRADLALRYLRESRDSIAEVAFLLGFSEVSTFHRAFRRWTGQTPAAYRLAGRAQTTKSAS